MSNQASYEAARQEADSQIAQIPNDLSELSIEDLEEAKYALTTLAAVLETELRDRYAAQNPMDTA